MFKALKYVERFGILAGVGILLGCWIHGARTNQPMIMSGVAFVREMPYGERTVGGVESVVFLSQEKWALRKFKKENEVIIDPEVLKAQNALFKKRAGN